MDDGLQSVQAMQGEESNPNERLTASFGIVVDEPYDPSRHKGEIAEWDPRDTEARVVNQIKWILTKGQTVPEAGLQDQLKVQIKLKELDNLWRVPVVTSDLPSSKLPTSALTSTSSDDIRLLYFVEYKPEFKVMGGIPRLKSNLLYPRKPKFFFFKHHLDFKIDPLTGRLSVTPSYEDGTPIRGSRIIWEDPENLNDGCSTILIPPPMYCLTRPESTAASLFQRIAEQRAPKDNKGQEGEDDVPANGNSLGNPDEDVGS